MRSLYSILESIVDSDEEAEKKIRSELDREVIREALIEFFKYLHIEVPNRDNSLNLDKESLAYKRRHILRFDMENYIVWITNGPQHGSDQWFQEKTWDSMCIQNQNFIRQALKEAFEKYLDRKRVKYIKQSRLNIKYSFGDSNDNYIEFLLYKNESPGLKKEYDKQTRGGKNTRESYLGWGWKFLIDIPENFWKVK